MKQPITDKLDLFIGNAQKIKNGFVWQNTLTKHLAALLYALENKIIDCTAVKNCHTLIKKNAGLFSMVKGNMSLCIAAMLSLNDDSEKLFSDTMTAYSQLKAAKFHACDYLAVSACLIASNTDEQNFQNVVERARAFYDGMKKYHKFHTGEDDYIYSVMFGLSKIDPISGTERIEQIYQQLKPEFSAGGNSVQALSQALVFGEKSDEALARLTLLRNALKSRKLKLDKTYTLPALGVLSMIPVDANILADDILESQNYLRAQKGFGRLSITTQNLLLFSSAIVLSAYANEMKDSVVASLSTSITGIIIAQHVAIIAAVSASTAAGAASS